MYVTHKAYDHVEWKKRKEERNSRGKSTTQRRDKTDKARSASSEGAPSKCVANYTRGIKSNWTPLSKPSFLRPTYPKNNMNQSWPGSRETRGSGRWCYQWLLTIFLFLPNIWCLPIGPVPTCPILFNSLFSVTLLDTHYLLRCPTVLWSLHGPH